MVLNRKGGMEKSDESRTRRYTKMRKYSKMDKRAKNKLVMSPSMEEDRTPKKIFTQELEGMRRKGDLGKYGKRKNKEIFKC